MIGLIYLSDATANNGYPTMDECRMSVPTWEAAVSVIPTERLAEFFEAAQEQNTSGYPVSPKDFRVAWNRRDKTPIEEAVKKLQIAREELMLEEIRERKEAELRVMGMEQYDSRKYPDGSPEHHEWHRSQMRILNQYDKIHYKDLGYDSPDEVPQLDEDWGWN